MAGKKKVSVEEEVDLRDNVNHDEVEETDTEETDAIESDEQGGTENDGAENDDVENDDDKEDEAGNLSPKAKASRGVDPSLVTAWVPIDQDKERAALIRQVAKYRTAKLREATGDKKASYPSVKVYADLIASVIDETIIEGWKAEAAKAPEPKAKGPAIDKMTFDQLNKQEELALKRMAALRAQMEKLRAKP